MNTKKHKNGRLNVCKIRNLFLEDSILNLAHHYSCHQKQQTVLETKKGRIKRKKEKRKRGSSLVKGKMLFCKKCVHMRE